MDIYIGTQFLVKLVPKLERKVAGNICFKTALLARYINDSYSLTEEIFHVE